METYECLKKLNFRAFLLLMQNFKKKREMQTLNIQKMSFL